MKQEKILPAEEVIAGIRAHDKTIRDKMQYCAEFDYAAPFRGLPGLAETIAKRDGILRHLDITRTIAEKLVEGHPISLSGAPNLITCIDQLQMSRDPFALFYNALSMAPEYAFLVLNGGGRLEYSENSERFSTYVFENLASTIGDGRYVPGVELFGQDPRHIVVLMRVAGTLPKNPLHLAEEPTKHPRFGYEFRYLKQHR